MRWQDGYEQATGKDAKRSDHCSFLVAISEFAWKNIQYLTENTYHPLLSQPRFELGASRTGISRARRLHRETLLHIGLLITLNLLFLAHFKFEPSRNVKPRYGRDFIIFGNISILVKSRRVRHDDVNCGLSQTRC
jgi:hypothetical protein